MIQSCIVFCVIFTIIGYWSERKVLNPISIINLMWGVILFFSSLKLYTLYQVRSEVYCWIFIGLIAYSIGYYLFKIFLKDGKLKFRIRSGKCIDNGKKIANYRRVYILYFICIVYIFYRMSRYGTAIISAGVNLSVISDVVKNSKISDKGIINAINFLIVSPLYLPLTIFFAVDFWMGKRDKKVLLLAVIMTIGRIIIYGGRHPVIQLFIAMVIALTFSCSKYQTLFYKKVKTFGRKRSLLPTIIIGIVVFGYLTFTKTTAVVKTIYLDFAMQPYMFQYWADNLGKKYAYGFASLFGFIHPILYIAKNLFRLFNDMPNFFSAIYNNIQDTFNVWIPIGENLRANAYTSSFWYLYYDGREFGIILGMFIWGILSYVFFSKAKRWTSSANVANYVMMAEAIIYTFTDMEFYKASYVLGFIYLNFLIFRKISPEYC